MRTRLFEAVARRVTPTAVFLIACGCTTGNSTGLSGYASDLASFSDRLETLRGQLDIPGMSAAVAMDGRLVWQQGFGFADVAARRAATPTTAYHAASLTKGFAATVLMRLVEQGALRLDDAVAAHGVTAAQLSGTGNGGAPSTVTVRHLLAMTSEGVTAGESFRYNGDRFGLLDHVIRSAAGKPFAELVVSWIVGPAGLIHTAPNVANAEAFAFAGLDAATYRANLASPYALQAGRVVAATYPAYFGTAAGLITTAIDLLRFSTALDHDSLIGAASREAMFAPATTPRGGVLPYASGWFSQMYAGQRVVWGYGYWTGNSSLLIKVPAKGLTFAILANSDQLSARFRLGSGDLLSSPLAREFIEAFVVREMPLASP
jgi:CubicO group peptidase (beta-lactamase class C family)